MRVRLSIKRAQTAGQGRGGAPAPDRGFALVEMLIGGSILGFSIISLYSAFSFGFGLIKMSQENVQADQILVQKLETLRLYDWSQSQLSTSGGIIPATFTESFSSGSAAPGTVYSGTVTITGTPVSESYGSTLRQVTVTLNWVSGKVARTRSMSTLVSQYGIQTYKH
jgi:hypothetical protein